MQIPNDDLAQLESYASIMAVDNNMPFEKALDILKDEYFDSLRRADVTGKGIDEEQFRENIYGFIDKNIVQ